MNILLIGCGNIGRQLLTSWANSQPKSRILVVQPSLANADAFANSEQIHFIHNIHALPADFKEDVTVLAVKPQHLHEVLPHIKSRHSQRFISVLAATPMAQFTAVFPATTRVFRFMPNIAMRTANSVNLLVAAQELNAEDAAVIQQLFAATGPITWLENEQELDNLTLIASSGIAYFLLLGELLAQEAIQLARQQKI